jgi:hypothetical protein
LRSTTTLSTIFYGHTRRAAGDVSIAWFDGQVPRIFQIQHLPCQSHTDMARRRQPDAETAAISVTRMSEQLCASAGAGSSQAAPGSSQPPATSSASTGGVTLEIREERAFQRVPDGYGMYVHGAKVARVASASALLAVVRAGNRHRSVRHTDMNQHSSRSHAILQLVIEQRACASSSLALLTGRNAAKDANEVAALAVCLGCCLIQVIAWQKT